MTYQSSSTPSDVDSVEGHGNGEASQLLQKASYRVATNNGTGRRDRLADDDDAMPSPKDRHRLVYWIILLHGIGALLPWNAFITLPGYFRDYKLENSTFQTDFLSYVGMSSQIPSLIMTVVNLFISVSTGLEKRIKITLTINIIICAITLLFVWIPTDDAKTLFFIITILSIIILNSSNGVYQNCVWGLASDFPAQYSNAVVLGNQICGVAVTVVSIISILIAQGRKQEEATFYFGVSTLTLICCLLTVFWLPKIKYFNFYHERNKAKRIQEEGTVRGSIIEETILTRPLTPIEEATGPWTDFKIKLMLLKCVSKEVWPQLLNVFLIFFVTLILFPAILSDVQPTTCLGVWMNSKHWLFVPITCFLFFNVTSAIGSYLADWIQFPKAPHLWIAVVSRLLFLPFFIFCNYRPIIRTFPVLIKSDIIYMVGVILMGLTNGYFASLAMMYAPRIVKPEHARYAGMAAGLFLILGITVGVNFSMVVAWIAESLGPINSPGAMLPPLNCTSPDAPFY